LLLSDDTREHLRELARTSFEAVPSSEKRVQFLNLADCMTIGSV